MPVPAFQKWLYPLLKKVSDGNVHFRKDLYISLADEMGLSPEDKNELLNSGRQLVYRNRIGWAQTYLKKAGLLKSTGKSQIQITDKGLEVIKSDIREINIKFLQQFPEFLEFQKNKQNIDDSEIIQSQTDIGISEETPEDAMKRFHNELQEELVGEILERIKSSPPVFFERLVVDLLLKMGYGGSREDAGKVIGKSGDGGIDGVINEDRLGLDTVYIQAKRWEGNVGRPIIQAFAGSLEGARAKKGIVITTSSFAPNALEYVKNIEKKIVLIDGRQLASLMIEFKLAVTTEYKYEINKIDNDYFEME